MSVSKTVALVTGGSRGLGSNIALKLAAQGTAVIITYNTRKDEALKVVEQINNTGVHAVALQLSTEHTDSFPGFFNTLADVLQTDFQTDRFDYLINNAGIGLHMPFEKQQKRSLICS
ncbi:SDR family NAD(P)-dependent oxidoreductase [Chitinophaga pinensis]|uniref:SDR family NAD(P)-dependent oxidoreductase n=1 Tax=Chitinophaga pinensis TaxID=79329 RepID=UPI0021BD848F|nr:SDR family NAD(P)-dependent oxidoreductase [Chitinophaga pinensis]